MTGAVAAVKVAAGLALAIALAGCGGESAPHQRQRPPAPVRHPASGATETPPSDDPPPAIADFHVRFPYFQRWARTYRGQISSDEFPTSCRGDAALIVHHVTLARLSIPRRPCGTGWQPLALSFSRAGQHRVLTRARRLHRNVLLYIRIEATVHRHPGDAHAWQGIVRVG